MQPPMQVLYSFLVCPECRHRNTPWRSFCKACRGPVRGGDGRPLARADATIRLYRSADGQRVLLVSAQYLAYEAPGLAIQSAWENIAALVEGAGGPYLRLRAPAALAIDAERYERARLASSRIPLAPFGYPGHSDLALDLRQHAPPAVGRRLRLA